MPDVTIVIPVLNGQATIGRAIASVLNQRVDVQLIVMDGGSTDGTMAVVEQYGAGVAHAESGPDGGQAAAINKGLRMATGTWFNWLNADDELAPGALKKVMEWTDKPVDVVTGFCRHVDHLGNELAIGGTVTQGSVEQTMANYSMGQPAHFYRTKALFDPLLELDHRLHYCMDMDLWFRYLILHGCDLVQHIPHILANFTVHPNSKSVAAAQAMKDEKYAIFQSVAECFGVGHILYELNQRASLFRKKYEIFDGFQFSTDVYIGNLAWHLMLEAYEQGRTGRARELFDLCCKGGRMTYGDTLAWRFRLTLGNMKLQTNGKFP